MGLRNTGGKEYSTKERVRANSFDINLAFSRVCGLFEDKT